MFYKTKSSAQPSSSSVNGTTQSDGLSKSIKADLPRGDIRKGQSTYWSTFVKFERFLFLLHSALLGSQQFYIYSIDGRTGHSTPNAHLDLPPKYEDVIKDPNYARREVA